VASCNHLVKGPISKASTVDLEDVTVQNGIA